MSFVNGGVVVLDKIPYQSKIDQGCQSYDNVFIDLVLYQSLNIIRLCRIITDVVFIETSTFTKLIIKYLSDDEYLGLQTFLLQFPDAGDIIRGTGGVRKLRWQLPGRGK